MNTFAAARSLGASPHATQRKRRPRLDQDAQLFLVSEGAVAVFALALAAVGWLIGTTYNAAWALWQARMMSLVAAWAAYLVVKAWATQLLDDRERPPLEIESDFATGD